MTMRGVARCLDAPVSSLYRHYTDLEDLVTDLVAETYSQLAVELLRAARSAGAEAFDQLSETTAASEAARVRAAALALRGWEREHPAEFELLLVNINDAGVAWTTKVEQARAVTAAPFAQQLDRAIEAGTLSPPPGCAAGLTRPPAERGEAAASVSLEAMALMLFTWSALTGHLAQLSRRAALVADLDAHWEAYVDRVLVMIGFTAPPDPHAPAAGAGS